MYVFRDTIYSGQEIIIKLDDTFETHEYMQK